MFALGVFLTVSCSAPRPLAALEAALRKSLQPHFGEVVVQCATSSGRVAPTGGGTGPSGASTAAVGSAAALPQCQVRAGAFTFALELAREGDGYAWQLPRGVVNLMTLQAALAEDLREGWPEQGAPVVRCGEGFAQLDEKGRTCDVQVGAMVGRAVVTFGDDGLAVEILTQADALGARTQPSDDAHLMQLSRALDRSGASDDDEAFAPAPSDAAVPAGAASTVEAARAGAP